MADLSTNARNALPTSAFALPRKRKFPLTSTSKARNALSGASHALHAGTISQAEYDKVVREANAYLNRN